MKTFAPFAFFAVSFCRELIGIIAEVWGLDNQIRSKNDIYSLDKRAVLWYNLP